MKTFWKYLFWMAVFPMQGIAQPVFDVRDFGAIGNGSALNTTALQQAIDSCNRAGGGVVLVSGGRYKTGTLMMRSHVELRIDSGATLLGSGSIGDYPDVLSGTVSYANSYAKKSLIYAEGVQNISFTGKGTIDFSGLSLDFILNRDDRPFGFRIINCQKVAYRDLRLRNSAFWMMLNSQVDSLYMGYLDIENHATGNQDGLSADACRDVLIEYCTADCNDDALVLKSMSLQPMERVEVKHCTFKTYSRAIKIGTETYGPVRDVRIHDCTVDFSSAGPLNGTAASCGILLCSVDGGSLENIEVSDISMRGIETPVLLRLGERGRPMTDTSAAPAAGFADGIQFHRITATATTNISSTLTGIPGYRMKNILMDDIAITYPGGAVASAPGLVLPENPGSKPENDMFGTEIPVSGLYLRHLDGVVLRNVCFYAQQADARPLIYTEDVLGLDSSGICKEVTAEVRSNAMADEPVVYPNPVRDRVTVDWKVAGSGVVCYRVSDLTGAVMQEFQVSENGKESLDLGLLGAGVYWLEGSVNGKRIFIRRLVKN